MPLQLALLFHFNQHLNEHALLASRVCYRGLLRVLRDRPSLKANIHISGTLLHALTWLDPEPLELIRDGLEVGQFELLGSTYAQNVLFASDDWDNARQIELHQQVLHDHFGITPTAFWNVERCWRQSLVPIIASAGYDTVLVEDHILEASGAAGARAYRTFAGEHSLKVVRDDQTLKHHFNFAAWFGVAQGLLAYLTRWLNHGGEFLAYAEDAEAMGLWGYSRGVDPTQTWARLADTLDELLQRPDIELSLLGSAPAPQVDCSPIRDGSAGWMDAALAEPGRLYHEDGYAGWFDFNRRSPKLAKYRRMHDRVRERIVRARPAPGTSGAQVLYRDALHVYLAHQYEFGCVGIGHEFIPYRGWDGMQAALVLARAAEWAAEPWEGVRWEDVNQDGVVEVCLSDGLQLAVLSPFGGRLLYWLDLVEGRQLLGNPLAVVPGDYTGDSTLPDLHTHAPLWMPGEGESPRVELVAEEPPTRLGRYLPDWIWEGQAEPLSLAVRQMQLPGEPQPYLTAQRRGFVDEFRIAGSEYFDPGEPMDLLRGEEAPGYSRRLGEALTLHKQYHLRPGTVEVVYTLRNSGPQTSLSMTTVCEVSLDYAAVLRYGRRALDFSQDPRAPEVINPQTGEVLALLASRPWLETVRREALLALEVGCAFEFDLPPGGMEAVTLTLARRVENNIPKKPNE